MRVFTILAGFLVAMTMMASTSSAAPVIDTVEIERILVEDGIVRFRVKDATGVVTLNTSCVSPSYLVLDPNGGSFKEMYAALLMVYARNKTMRVLNSTTNVLVAGPLPRDSIC